MKKLITFIYFLVSTLQLITSNPLHGTYQQSKVKGGHHNRNEVAAEPRHKIFSPNFKFKIVIGNNENGNNVKWIDKTPSKFKLNEIERNVDNSEYVQNQRSSKRMRMARDLKATRRRRPIKEPLNEHVKDYVVIKSEPISNLSTDHLSQRKILVNGPLVQEPRHFPKPGSDGTEVQIVRPELAIVVDDQFCLEFNCSNESKKLNEYLAVMVNYVNDRYALNKDPKIKFQIATVIAIYNEAIRTEILGPAVVEDTSLDITLLNATILLQTFSVWAYKNPELLGKYDIAPFISGRGFTGVFLGLAYLGGACKLKEYEESAYSYLSKATLVVSDEDVYLSGAMTLAHELGHSLGAVHDGDVDDEFATMCPWEGGYVMSYIGYGGINKASFSSCSQRVMKAALLNETLDCLYEKSSSSSSSRKLTVMTKTANISTQLNASSNGFDHILPTFRNICDLSAYTPAVAYQNPDDQCRNVMCYINGEVPPEQQIYYFPGNNLPCGKTGVCRNGYCVNPGQHLNMTELCWELYEPSTIDNAGTLVNVTWIQNGFTMDEICSGKENAFQCNTTVSAGTEIHFQGPLIKTFTPVPGTPCGNDSVCFHGRCIYTPDLTVINTQEKADKACILQTGKNIAKAVAPEGFEDEGHDHQDVDHIHEHKECTKGIKCHYGTEYEYLKGMEPNNGALCNTESGEGECFEGHCVSSRKPVSLYILCVWLTENENIEVNNEFTRDQLCTRLECITPDFTRYSAPINSTTPENTICGPLRRCRKGKCEICGGRRHG